MSAAHDGAAKIVKNRCLQARTISHNRSHLVHPLCRVGYARELSLSAATKGSLILLPVSCLPRERSRTFYGTVQGSQAFLIRVSRGHSFRIGAGSVAAAGGLPDWLIKVMGRWSSDCYQLYIRTPISTIETVARRMANRRCSTFFAELAFHRLSWLGGDALPCMHQLRLSLRSDFPQAC